MAVSRIDQVVATFSMTGGAGSYTGPFTEFQGFSHSGGFPLVNGSTYKVTVFDVTSTSNVTRPVSGKWEEYEGVYSSASSGSITRGRFINSSTGSAITWTNPTTCGITIGPLAEDFTNSCCGVTGDGSDGAVTFDGTTTTLGIVPSSNVYTLNREIYCTTLTINAGVTLKTGGFPIWVTGVMTNNGNINDDGGNGGNGTASFGGAVGAAAAGTTSALPTVGGWGVTATPGTGGVGVGVTSVGSVNGTVGVNSLATNNIGKAGGASDSITGTGTAKSGGLGGTGGSATTFVLRTLSGMMYGIRPAALNSNIGLGSAGAGGGSGAAGLTGAGSATSGGGGGGGGFVVIIARSIVNNGTISANGGNAGNALVTGSPTAAAAGASGGGGGGLVVLGYSTFTGTAATANGGTKGTSSTVGAGAVSGAAANGTAGTVFTYQL